MTITAYNQMASTFFSQYQPASFERVHGDWSSLLPDQAGLALDIGAASGGDALALTERGWDVIAVEPAAELRRLGEQESGKASVQWFDDQLSDLAQVRKLSYGF